MSSSTDALGTSICTPSLPVVHHQAQSSSALANELLFVVRTRCRPESQDSSSSSGGNSRSDVRKSSTTLFRGARNQSVKCMPYSDLLDTKNGLKAHECIDLLGIGDESGKNVLLIGTGVSAEVVVQLPDCFRVQSSCERKKIPFEALWSVNDGNRLVAFGVFIGVILGGPVQRGEHTTFHVGL